MARLIALLLLFLGLFGCIGEARSQPALPDPDASERPDGVLLRRLMADGAMNRPLLPQPGNIWADTVRGQAPPAAPQKPMTGGHAAPRPAIAAAPLVAAPVGVEPAPAGRLQVQLAAADTAQGAVAAWRRLRQRAPALTDGHDPAIVQAEVKGRQVWRLRTGGFPDVAAASAFCAGIRAAKADCWVVAASSGL